MRQAIFAGSFDPLTTGHLWMIREATKLFDVVHVLVAVNPGKKTMFSPSERQAIILGAVKREGLIHVNVDVSASEFVAQVATRKGVDYLIRGLRSTADFDLEDLLRQTNKELFDGPQTVFLIPPKGLSSVISSFVKALVGSVGWVYAVSEFLPEESDHAMLSSFLLERWTRLMREISVNVPCRPATFFKDVGEYFKKHLEPSYRATGRAYHAMSHIAHCLSELDALTFNCPANLESDTQGCHQLELAIFFHDLVYRGGPLPVLDGEGDEEASARYAMDFLKETVKASTEFLHPVERAILGTRYALVEGVGQDWLLSAMRDIDLSILGRPRREYSRYLRAIRDEYQDVPYPMYATARGRILKEFLAKAENNRLFSLDWFVSRGYNQQAVHNLQMEIDILGAVT